MFLKKSNKQVVIWFLFAGTLLAQSTNIVINEFLSSNAHVNYDPDYRNYSDWFELYSNENYPINLNGYYLTDDLSKPTKWRIQHDLIIDANGYLVLWADDGDLENHTNFQLSRDGEQIGLYTPSGAVVDTISFKYQKTDISYGRNPNNDNEWMYYYNPTPGAINNTIGNTDLINCSPPKFSENSGFYEADLFLEITSAIDTEIRYTLDGSEPDENSKKYTAPINITDRAGNPNYFSEIPTNINPYSWIKLWGPPAENVRKATVVRAKAFASNKLPSKIITNTFFIGAELSSAFNTIPVISLVSDEKHLFSDSAGIYVPGESYDENQGQGNYMKDWNRPAHFEFFDEQGYSQISQEIDTRTQGLTSQVNPQKGLQIIARNKYGKNIIDYPFFKKSGSKANKIISFKRIMIRAWGSNWQYAMFSDAFAHKIYEKSSLDIQDYLPVIVFINGEYWGLHEIREANKNPYYYQEHYGIDKDNPGIDLIVGGKSSYVIDEGDDGHWKTMIAYMDNNDLSIDQNYEYIKTQMDVDNFIDYIGHTVYCGKFDWPGQNEAFWRPRTSNGRWKWIQYDMDTSFGLQQSVIDSKYDMINHVINGGITNHGFHPILVSLLQNQKFKVKFINWFLDHIHSDFLPEILKEKLKTMVIELYPYIEEHRSRWAMSDDYYWLQWQYNINKIYEYLNTKSNYIISHLQSNFSLGKINTLILGGINNGGIVKINSLLIDKNTPGYIKNEWLGEYFSDVPITLTAIPDEGYVFDRWEGSVDSQSDSITTYLTDNSWVSAVFSPIQKIDSLYINEFLVNNRNLVDDSEKATSWIEFYNAGTDTVNIQGLFLTHDFLSPTMWNISTLDKSSLAFPPKEYKVLFCNDTSNNLIYDFNTILNSTGGQLGLVQIAGTDTVFVDSVSYPIQFPNVTYGRLPQSTNSWAFLLHPTPGAQNIYSPSGRVLKNLPELLQSYPNPFSNVAVIPFYLPDIKNYSLSIFDIGGTLIKEFSILPQIPGYRSIVWGGQDFRGKTVPSGVYFYSLFSDKLIQTKKILFIK